jgi:hypothetical protein
VHRGGRLQMRDSLRVVVERCGRAARAQPNNEHQTLMPSLRLLGSIIIGRPLPAISGSETSERL